MRREDWWWLCVRLFGLLLVYYAVTVPWGFFDGSGWGWPLGWAAMIAALAAILLFTPWAYRLVVRR